MNLKRKDLDTFQLEFRSISRVIHQMTYYNFECSHWWKIYFKSPLQNFLSSLNAVILTNESTQIITGHGIYNPAYTYKFQLKTTQMFFFWFFSCDLKDFKFWYVNRKAFGASSFYWVDFILAQFLSAWLFVYSQIQ